jgi:hypothetical protein
MKLKKSCFSLLIFFLLLTINISAQKSNVGNWFVYLGNQKINNQWNWHNELQYRNFNFLGDLNQLLLRTGIGYNLTENNNNILLGYGFINSQKYISDSNEKVGTNEHRIYQQFITKQSFDKVFLQHRYRIEERFLPNDFQMRFRYFIGINIPINKPKIEKNAFYLSGYNEIFINAQQHIFDRNRLYGAIGYVINKNIKMEGGYMAQTVSTGNRNQFQIVVFNNIPFTNN